MAEKRIEFVVAADCMGEGEIYLRGEVRTASEPVYRALRGAGRVCLDDAAEEAARADLALRQPKKKGKPDEKPADAANPSGSAPTPADAKPAAP